MYTEKLIRKEIIQQMNKEENSQIWIDKKNIKIYILYIYIYNYVYLYIFV